MEFVAGGDLYQMIKKKKKITERNSAILMKGVVEALEEMHKYIYQRYNIGKIMSIVTLNWRTSCLMPKKVLILS